VTYQDRYDELACRAQEEGGETALAIMPFLRVAAVCAGLKTIEGKPQTRTRNPVQSAWDQFTIRQRHAMRGRREHAAMID